ncbi:MAG TPA: HypC/HybG/HupF family hydrogenase formation chaperone [Syntrophomonadaceae bacterium]|jgi:hydrogenase expression/formation protein HypC|nr:HypC/HybG/HupF family hydrogenase formation chaperone [Syntrophomonadaceae bacterium]HRX20925.1 HypC/HybG/HupF family hydrogenase formation chaperone [Syntrophomonadaceae bacterium]
MCLGVPAKVIEIRENSTALVDVNGNQTEINIRLTPEVQLDQYVLVHAGFAMEIIDESIARETMQYLEEIMQYE